MGPDPEKHIGSTPLRARTAHARAMLRAADGREYSWAAYSLTVLTSISTPQHCSVGLNSYALRACVCVCVCVCGHWSFRRHTQTVNVGLQLHGIDTELQCSIVHGCPIPVLGAFTFIRPHF